MIILFNKTAPCANHCPRCNLLITKGSSLNINSGSTYPIITGPLPVLGGAEGLMVHVLLRIYFHTSSIIASSWNVETSRRRHFLDQLRRRAVSSSTERYSADSTPSVKPPRPDSLRFVLPPHFILARFTLALFNFLNPRYC